MLISILLGAVIGWIASKLMHSKGGILINILLGIAGSAVGNFLAGLIGLGPTNSIGSILIGVGGACVVVLLCRKLFK